MHQPFDYRILTKWLIKIGIPVSEHYLKHSLQLHPDYPSIYSITDVIEKMGIDCLAVEIEAESLDEVPLPFLANMRSSDGLRFELIENLNATKESAFSENWTGIVIAADKPKHFKNAEIDNYLKNERESKYLIILIAILSVFFFSRLNLFSEVRWLYIFSISALAGLLISVLIVLKDLGLSNKMLEEVCTEDCETVKDSTDINWGELGLIYFSVQIVFIAFSATENAPVRTLFNLLSLFSLGFIAYSLFYQWKIVKKWCKLCLGILSILAVQLANAVWYQETFQISIPQILSFISVAAFIYISWALIKPLIKNYFHFQAEYYRLNRFRNNTELFKNYQENRPQVPQEALSSELELANPLAHTKIIVACNPFCKPCAEVHHKLEQLIDRFGEQISLIIRWNVNTQYKEHKRYQAAHYLLSIACSFPIEKRVAQTRILLNEWFGKMDFQAFKEEHSSFNISVEESIISRLLEEHEQWAETANVEYTPSIFINGRLLTKPFDLGDVYNFLKYEETPALEEPETVEIT